MTSIEYSQLQQEDYYDDDQYYNDQRDMDLAAQGQEAKPLTLQEEKEALKRRLKEIDKRHKKVKYKKEPKDILNDPKGKFNQNTHLFPKHSTDFGYP